MATATKEQSHGVARWLRVPGAQFGILAINGVHYRCYPAGLGWWRLTRLDSGATYLVQPDRGACNCGKRPCEHAAGLSAALNALDF